MKSEISFFEFYSLLWTKKIFIILTTLFFLCLGFIYNYLEHKNKNYRGTIIVYSIDEFEEIQLKKLKLSSRNQYNEYFLDIENFKNSLFDKFYKNLNSAEIWMKGLKSLDFFKNSKDPEKKYDNQIFKFIDTEDLIIEKDDNTRLILTIRYNDPIKLELFIDWLINETAKNINYQINTIIENIFYDIDSEILNFEKKINEHKERLIKYNISDEKILEYTIQSKVELLRLDSVKKTLKNTYNNSSFKNLKFMPVKYDRSSILIEEIQTYRLNYPLIGFLFGLFLSITIIIIRSSYFEFIKNKNIND